MLVYLFAFQNH